MNLSACVLYEVCKPIDDGHDEDGERIYGTYEHIDYYRDDSRSPPRWIKFHAGGHDGDGDYTAGYSFVSEIWAANDMYQYAGKLPNELIKYLDDLANPGGMSRYLRTYPESWSSDFIDCNTKKGIPPLDKAAKPIKAEKEVLDILRETRRPMRTKEIVECFERDDGRGVSSVKQTMPKLIEKGLVTHDRKMGYSLTSWSIQKPKPKTD